MHSVIAQRIGIWGALALAVCLETGCSPAHHRRVADRQAMAILKEKTPLVPNMDTEFSLEGGATHGLDRLPEHTDTEEALGAERESEKGARVVSLKEALAMAVSQSREYQTQKEMLYLAALSLTVARNAYTPIFSSGASARVANQPQDVARAIDEVAGTQTSLIQRDTEVVQQYNAAGSANNAGTILLRSGANLATSFNIDFLRFLNGDPRWFVRSSLAASVTQPLLRGAGYQVTMENLTQAERSTLYALREFTQFRKDFVVRIVQSYFGVLQDKDSLRNQWRSYQSYRRTAEIQRALAEEGRIPKSDLGQIEQSLLDNESAWINTVRTYRRSLDQFKILLGLPTQTRVILDDRDLSELTIVHPQLAPEVAVEVALATRLDVATARDRVADAERQVGLAANRLKAQLDLALSGSIDNEPGSLNPFALDAERARGSAGLTVDLPVERTGERANYRSALIRREQSSRQLTLLEDNLKLQVWESWRALDQAKRSHELSERGVALAERRVEEQELRAELGKVNGLALVDAQTALINSRNRRTASLIGHTLARLQFWNSMGLLYIKDRGLWEEPSHALKQP
jgi:outer membrane protein TolC